MSSAIATFFQTHFAQHDTAADTLSDARRARLSAAALLIETVNADGVVTADERNALFASLKTQFSLSDAEASALVALAERQARQATDLYEFTAAVNRVFSDEQKVSLVEELWRAAYADSVLHRHEERVIRKIANLLYVPNVKVLAAKYRVQERQAQKE